MTGIDSDSDRDVLLTFYDFPAEHWVHLRTTNPVESTFATVRLRTNKKRGMLTRDTMLTMVFKLSLSAQQLSVLGEAFKPRWIELGVQNSMLDVFVPQIRLYCPRVDAL